MFTRQSALLARLREHIGDPAADIMLQVFAQCNAPLEHRGPVTIDFHGTGATDGSASTDVALTAPSASIGTLTVTDTLVFGGLELSSINAKWAICQSAWETPDGSAACNHVLVKACDDCEATTISGDAFDVLLPEVAGKDPNLTGTGTAITSDIIVYIEASDGSKVIASDYLDDKIGTVKMWYKTEVNIVPAGWLLMDGASNSAESGIDMTGHLLKGKTTTGAATGSSLGSATHNHDGTTGTGAHEHGMHTGVMVEAGVADTEVWSAVSAAHQVTLQESPVHDHTIPATTTVTDWPLHKELHFIERVDNSL